MDYLQPNLSSTDVASHSVLTLAYIGDGVYELMVRTRLAASASLSNEEMHRRTLGYVNANSQAVALNAIRPLLTEEENTIFLRGRNAHTSVPKSASPASYHAATGLEALFGWLWLSGRRERLYELFTLCVDAVDSSKT